MRAGSRAAAVRITASGASTPVQRSNASAAWWTSMPSPLAARIPRERAAARKGVSIGWYTVSTTNCPGLRRSTGSGPASPCIPSGVAFTTRANTPGSTSSSRVPLPAGHQAGGGEGRVPSAGGDGHPGAGAPQGEHDGPGGAAGAGDEHVGARGVEAFVAHRPQEALTVGGRPGQAAVGLDGHDVHRAEGGRVGGELVAGPGRVGLVRHGDGEAREAERTRRRHRLRRRGRVVPGTPGRSSRGRLPGTRR